jgi:hypothetical protein
MAAKKGKPRKDAGAGELVWIAAKGLLALGLVAGVVYGIAWLGGYTGKEIQHRDRYAVRVLDLACDTPPGIDRIAFLTEVRYLGNLPETVPALDPATKDRLADAFRKHPWVARVGDVTLEPDGALRVELAFRTPVLVVQSAGEREPRVVDRSAVLLPAVPDPGALPRLIGLVPAPTRPAGEVWSDATVRRAAELADLHRPRTIEKIERGWRLTQPDGRVFVVSW